MIIKNLKNCLAKETDTIKSSFEKLEKSGKQIIFVINSKKKLLGSMTDGDLRRAILNNYNLNDNIQSIYNKKAFTASKKITEIQAKIIMQEKNINHLPLIDNKNKIFGFYSKIFDKKKINKINCEFVLMAGGKGKRLRPLTNNCPKPMLKISGKPIIETILTRANKQGFLSFIISINYLGYKIENYFKDGKKFGFTVDYIKEKKPQGTIGSLGNIKSKLKAKYTIVCNGDLISEINYLNLIKFHEYHKSSATMVVSPYQIQNPYGEVKTKNTRIISIREKPTYMSYINAGVYIFNTSMIKLIKKNQSLDAVTFFELLRKKNKKTLAFPIHESWQDIGLKEDFLKLKSLDF